MPIALTLDAAKSLIIKAKNLELPKESQLLDKDFKLWYNDYNQMIILGPAIDYEKARNKTSAIQSGTDSQD